LVIWLLAMGVLNTTAASPKSTLQQHLMECGKCADRSLWGAQFHAHTRRGVQHPGGHHHDDAWADLYVDNLTRRSLLAVLTAHTATVQRVPAIENLDLLPDMGRMSP
jgi:hypothetical protein